MNIRGTLLLVLFLFLCIGTSQAQDQKASIWDQAKKKSTETGSKQKDESDVAVSAMPMEGPIDAAQYIVGPSDVIALIFWGVPPTEYTVAVTPEGTLLIPTVGEVQVADLTLAAAKKKVNEAVEKKYLKGSFSMTLIRPRSLLVSLQGAVTRPGVYIASPTDRVEKIIMAGASDVKTPNTTFTIPALGQTGLPLTQEEIKVPKITTKVELDDQTSTRNIKILRRTGDTLNVDIAKYYATLQSKYNPFLMDGDMIIVPDKNLATNSVTLSGAVNQPGRYEYVAGDSLLAFIRIGHGLLETADRSTATIFRTDPFAQHTTEIHVNLQAILDGKQPDVPLERCDRVLVRPQVDKRQYSLVTVGGEVLLPGVYPIAQEATKLSTVIRMSGGLTGRALINGAVVWRKEEKYTIPDVQQLDYLTFLRAHQFDLVDSTYFFLTLKTGRQPVVVDFKRLLVNRDSTADIVLQPDDYVYIPANDHSVLVQGQVGQPGHIAYVPGANYKYYIRQAGDFQEFAEEGEVRIIKAGTLSWFKPGDTSIEPGDRVWVPKESKSTFWSYFAIFRDLASVGISIATLIYVSRK